MVDGTKYPVHIGKKYTKYHISVLCLQNRKHGILGTQRYLPNSEQLYNVTVYVCNETHYLSLLSKKTQTQNEFVWMFNLLT